MRNERMLKAALTLCGTVGIGAVVLACCRPATELASRQLEEVYASCDRCCDDNGSWNLCDPVSAPCAKATPPQFHQGELCASQGAACEATPSGPSNAQCEFSFVRDVYCKYGPRIACHIRQVGECVQHDYLHEGIPFHSCTCDNIHGTGEYSMTRISCSGDQCAL